MEEAEVASQDLCPELAQFHFFYILWVKAVKQPAQIQGSGETHSISWWRRDGDRLHCRTARRTGNILAVVFGKYNLLHPGSHRGRTAINIL